MSTAGTACATPQTSRRRRHVLLASALAVSSMVGAVARRPPTPSPTFDGYEHAKSDPEFAEYYERLAWGDYGAILTAPGPDITVVQSVMHQCFDPAQVHRELQLTTYTESPTPTRIARARIGGDADYVIYNQAWVGPRCNADALTSDDIVLVTHLTVDRIEQLYVLLQRWGGESTCTFFPIVKPICWEVGNITCHTGTNIVDSTTSIARRRDRAGRTVTHGSRHYLFCIVTVQRLGENLMLHLVVGSGAEVYPFNIMRNAALQPWLKQSVEDCVGATDCPAGTRRNVDLAVAGGANQRLEQSGPWIWSIDLDGTPSVSAEVASRYMKELGAVNPRTFYSVTPFETHSNIARAILDEFTALPYDDLEAINITSRWIKRTVLAGNAEVFHASYHPDGYLARTPICEWLNLPLGTFDGKSVNTAAMETACGGTPTPMQCSSNETTRTMLRAEYRWGFEPYAIQRAPVPAYDEFYRGRGYDRSAWYFQQCAHGEYTIEVLPQLYLFVRSDYDSYRGFGKKADKSTRTYNWGRWEILRKKYEREYGVKCGFGKDEDRKCWRERGKHT